MGHRHDGSARTGTPGGQVVGQPRHPFDIEMVGRLVKKEQVRIGGQEPRQGQPATLAARQGAHDRLEPADVGGVDAAEQAVEDVADAGVAGPDMLGQVAEHCLADSGLRVEGVDLGEHGDGQRPEHGDAPCVHLLDSPQGRAAGWTCRHRCARRRRCGYHW